MNNLLKINKMKDHFPKILVFVVVYLLFFISVTAQEHPDWENFSPDGCTSITVGRLATADGSVITSHTDDSHRTRSWINVILMKKHNRNENTPLYKRIPFDSLAMPTYKHIQIGEIPQVNVTYGYINTAYPCMNQHQVGVGESTFGGREELQSDSGLIDCQMLCQLILERCKSARSAILLAGELTGKYGWNDFGECLTISDKNEVWHFEILGPGKGKTGSVWAAQRVPDDHISVNANASRIMEIDLSEPDYFLASANVFSLAKENNWWDETRGSFRFCYAYAPESRTSFASRRREWRVLDLAAPSLGLDPNAENYPFSVKPDQPVTLDLLVSIFKDYYEGTIYIPVYCSVSDLPEPYKTPGRPSGYTTESAWWAFNRLGTMAAQRWGDMRHDVDEVWEPWQQELFQNQKYVEEQALKIYSMDNPDETIKFLTDYTNEWGYKVVKKAWELGDFLWTKYDELF